MDARHTGNLLLDAIPVDEREALLIDVAERPIDIGGTWLAAGDQIDSVLFPISGSMSLIAETGDSSVEAATVGREGVVDVFAALASRIAPQRVIGQVPGSFLAIPVDHFQKVYDHSPAVRRLIQGYIEALFVQISVNAACLAVHHLNERCARWLLQTHDRVDNDTFELKQEFLAMMLGVHRPSVSIAAGTLQASGLITYKRGKITVLDRQALEDAACPCYETTRSAYSRLVPLG